MALIEKYQVNRNFPLYSSATEMVKGRLEIGLVDPIGATEWEMKNVKLLVLGFAHTPEMVATFAQKLSEEGRCRVVVVSIPGVGGSQLDEGAPTAVDFADAIYSVAHQLLLRGSFITLVMHSMGAFASRPDEFPIFEPWSDLTNVGLLSTRLSNEFEMTVVQTYYMSPTPSHADELLGVQPYDPAFLWEAFLQMVVNLGEAKTPIAGDDDDWYFAEHPEADKEKLRKIVNDNFFSANPRSLISLFWSADQRPLLRPALTVSGDITLVLMEEDIILGTPYLIAV